MKFVKPNSYALEMFFVKLNKFIWWLLCSTSLMVFLSSTIYSRHRPMDHCMLTQCDAVLTRCDDDDKICLIAQIELRATNEASPEQFKSSLLLPNEHFCKHHEVGSWMDCFLDLHDGSLLLYSWSRTVVRGLNTIMLVVTIVWGLYIVRQLYLLFKPM